MSGQTKAKVLIVDDECVHRFMLHSMFGDWGWEAEEADDGATAVAAVEQGPFDAILMDVRMPVMDGLEATRRIRALPRPDALDVPIIATTANAYDDDVKHCLAAGMNDHVAKPIEAAVLFQSIHRLVKKTGTPE